jgi:hypothetical protein
MPGNGIVDRNRDDAAPGFSGLDGIGYDPQCGLTADSAKGGR